MNKVQLIGYLGKDPEYKVLPDGHEVATMRLATDYWFHPKEGEPRKFTDWHSVTLFSDEQVRKMKNYILKGSHVLIEGRLSYRCYKTSDGTARFVSEIKANLLIDLDR